MSASNSDTQQIKYRVIDQIFTPPDDHQQLEDDVYVAEYAPELERVEGAELIEILDYDYGQDDRIFTGPPELVVSDENELAAVVPRANGTEVGVYKFSEWTCERCESVTHTAPLIVGSELSPPHECVGCEREGPFTPTGHQDSATRKLIQTILTEDPIWEPPGGITECEIGDVWDEVRDHIETYWDARGREWLYEMATAYALSTWFREEFDALPHILVMGKTETGKTRFLNTLKEVCYRCVHTVGASPSYIYRAIDEYGITYFLSEYHDIHEDAQRTIDQVIKAGQKRGEVVGRTSEMAGGKYVPENFRPFTHVAVSTQYEPRDDIVNRCHEIRTKPAGGDVPRKVDDRRSLRAKMLYLRYRYLNSPEFEQARASAEEYMDNNGIRNRLGEKMWCLLTVAELADRGVGNFIQKAIEQNEADKGETEDALALRSIIDQAFEEIAAGQTKLGDDNNPWDGLKVPYAGVCEGFEDMTGREMTPSRLGHICKRLDLHTDRYRDGTYIDDEDLYPKLHTLAEENNIEWDTLAEANNASAAADVDEDGSTKPARFGDADVVEHDEYDDCRKAVIDAVADLEEKMEDGATWDRVVDLVSAQEWDEDTVEDTIESLVSKGRLTERPDRGLTVSGGA